MREISFKAKLTTGKQWLYGNIQAPEPPYNRYFMWSNKIDQFEVIPETVCQFVTTNNKGIRCYEGDYDSEGNVIVWCEQCMGWQFGSIDIPSGDVVVGCRWCEGDFHFTDHFDEFEPIGNIHNLKHMSMIATLDNLVKEAEEIHTSLTEEIINDDGNAAAIRGGILGSYVARTAKMLADAKYHQDMARKAALARIYTDNPKIPPSIAKDLADSECAIENRVFMLIERLNRAATHQYSFCVTIISKAKAEMQLQPRM